MILGGGCHCGAVTVELETALSPAELPLRECQCRFCRCHAARNTVDAAGRARIVAARGALVRYRFGARTADFLLCGRCGIYVAAVLDDAFASINTRVFDDGGRLTQAPRAVDYSGESADARRARRRASWTPVTVEERL